MGLIPFFGAGRYPACCMTILVVDSLAGARRVYQKRKQAAEPLRIRRLNRRPKPSGGAGGEVSAEGYLSGIAAICAMYVLSRSVSTGFGSGKHARSTKSRS
jgi:hypothetical protein